MAESHFNPEVSMYWREKATDQSVFDMIVKGERLVSKTGMSHEVSRLCRTVEPFDEILGYSEEVETSTAFYKGLLVGLSLGRYTADSERDLKGIQGTIGELNLAFQTEGSPAEIRHSMAQAILDKGQRALTSNPELAELLDSRFIDFIEDQGEYQFHAKSGVGFGFMVVMAHLHGIEAVESEHAQPISEDDISAVDWELEISRLLSSDE